MILPQKYVGAGHNPLLKRAILAKDRLADGLQGGDPHLLQGLPLESRNPGSDEFFPPPVQGPDRHRSLPAESINGLSP